MLTCQVCMVLIAAFKNVQAEHDLLNVNNSGRFSKFYEIGILKKVSLSYLVDKLILIISLPQKHKKINYCFFQSSNTIPTSLQWQPNKRYCQILSRVSPFFDLPVWICTLNFTIKNADYLWQQIKVVYFFSCINSKK